MNVIPEDYDDDDFEAVPYQQPFHQSGSGSIPDTIYEDKSKIQAAGLRQTSLSQLGEKKRYRPPTMISASAMQMSGPGNHSMRNVRSPSAASFATTSSGGDRSSVYHYVPQQQQQQQPQQYQYYQQPPHQQYQQQQQQQPQQFYQYQGQNQYLPQQQQQRPQYVQSQPQGQFQPPIHYQYQQRSQGSLLSPASSSVHLPQPPKKHIDAGAESSLTPSSSFEQDRNELPVTPESMDRDDNEEKQMLEGLNEKAAELEKENGDLNDQIAELTRRLNEKELQLESKNNIIEAKSKQLALREEKLNNKDRQIDILNKRLSPGAQEGTVSSDVHLKLQKTNEELSAKVLSLLKQIEEMKTSDNEKFSKVNKDLSAKVVTLLGEIESLKAKQPQTFASSPRAPLTPRADLENNNKKNKTIKDMSREELFKLEFLQILEVLNNNQYYYENKIKVLQLALEDHKRLIYGISNTKKSVATSSAARKGLKVIDIVPPRV